MIHAILFNKHKLSFIQCLNYLKRHGYHPYKIHETQNFYRFIINPKELFKSFFTKRITPNIEYIIGLNLT